MTWNPLTVYNTFVRPVLGFGILVVSVWQGSRYVMTGPNPFFGGKTYAEMFPPTETEEE